MKTNKADLLTFTIVLTFLLMAVASAPPRRTYQSKPQPCTKHQPINYSPVLVKVNISGSYSMKDLTEVQRIRPTLVLDNLNSVNYGKYQIADGVTPNLNLYITLNNDNYGHYGASITGYVYDGNFNFTINTDYVTLEKLYSDIAYKINGYITGGWCKNCPAPCVIN